MWQEGSWGLLTFKRIFEIEIGIVPCVVSRK